MSDATQPPAPILEITDERRSKTRQNKAAFDKLIVDLGCCLPDADNVAQELAAFGVLEQAAALPPSYDVDVCTAIVSHFSGLSKYDRNTYKKEIADLRREQKEKSGEISKKPKRAVRTDYFKLFAATLGDMRRDILSGSLMTKCEGSWQPCVNYLNLLGSEAADYEDSHALLFSQGLVEKHLAALEFATEPELLIKIPKWDGVDRVREIADVIKCSNCSAQHFYELILQFGVVMFERLNDPEIQPITPIFQGAQNIGKDTLIKSLLGGLDYYFRKLNVSGYDVTEAVRQLHTGLVFHIPEFDKTTSKKDAAALKELMSDSFTDVRLPWGRSSQKRDVRCSFIASANPEGVLTDPTGGRRYWVFNIIYAGFDADGNVERTYPGHFAREGYKDERLQILSQFQTMVGYRASKEAKAGAKETIETLTPENYSEMLLHEFDRRLDEYRESPARIIGGIPYYSYRQIKEILADLGREFEVRQRMLLSLLKLSKRLKRLNTDRLYCSMTGHHLVSVTGKVTEETF